MNRYFLFSAFIPVPLFMLLEATRPLSRHSFATTIGFVRSKQWWYIFGAFAWTVPIANYLLLGEQYWTDWQLMVVASVFLYCVYALAISACSWSVERAVQFYPSVSQTFQRLLTTFFGVVIATLLTISLTLYLYHTIPLFSVSITHAMWLAILRLGLIFDVLFCLAYGCLYMLEKWREKQTENESLQRIQLENQLDALKTQVNPHFLFNSLNSLSSLVSEDAQRAEQFVDELAKVYRYMLHTESSTDPSRGHDLASLDAELRFAASYAYLLKTRYASGISFTFASTLPGQAYFLPRLTLQTLIDNATRHNVISASQPLHINIQLKDGALVIKNNRQVRRRQVDTIRGGLQAVLTRYTLLGGPMPTVRENDTSFSVSLPLFPAIQPVTA